MNGKHIFYRILSLGILTVLLFVFRAPLNAQWSKNSLENNAIAVVDGSAQLTPIIAKNGDNGVVIVWVDTRFGDSDLYFMRVNEAGEPLGSEGGNALIAQDEDQESPAILGETNGEFYLAWQDMRGQNSENEIFMQKFTREGMTQWPNDVVALPSNNKPPSMIRISPDDIAVAAFNSNIPFNTMSYQILDSDGNRTFDPLSIVSAGAQTVAPTRSPVIVPALTDGFIAVWTDARSDTAIYAKGVNSDGSEWAPGEIVVTDQITAGGRCAAVGDGNNGVIIVWLQPSANGTSDDIRAVRFDAQGEMVWGATPVQIAAAQGAKTNLRVISDNQGGAYLAWETEGTTDSRVYVQRLAHGGTARDQDRAVTVSASAQFNPEIITNGRGNLVVAWQDGRNDAADIYAQLIDGGGDLLWDPDGVAVTAASRIQQNHKIVDDGLGGVILTWEDDRRGVTPDIFAQRVSVTGELGEFRTIEVTAPVSDDAWEIGSQQTIEWTASEEIDSLIIELTRDAGTPEFETVIDTVENAAPENGQLILDVSGPASDNCKIRIRALRPDFILAESNTFQILASAGPDIQIGSGPQTGVVGQDVQIIADVTDVSGISEVTLNYAAGGARLFNVVQMTADGGQYSASIPGSAITERGTFYFIASTDAIGTQSVTDTTFLNVTFPAGVQTRQIQAGSAQESYRMISAPNQLDDPAILFRLGSSGFSEIDTTSWRVFQYRSDAYVELDSTTFDDGSFVFRPGSAFWIITAQDQTVDFGAGTSLRADTSATITLTPGWNQIANPFAFSVAWDTVLTASGAPQGIQQPHLYSGNFNRVNVIQPYEGYFLLNPEQTTVTLTVPPVAAQQTNSTPGLAKTNLYPAPEWEIQVQAFCEKAADTDNFIGIHPEASEQWDRFDHPEPPPIGEYVSVYFPNHDWQLYPNNYTTDYRPNFSEGLVWEVEITTNIRNSEARVRFDGLLTLPQSLKAILLDEALNVTQDLSKHPQYSFSTGQNGAQKTLKLFVGNDTYLSEEIADLDLVPTDFELSQNFPNPFNPSTTIRYGLPRAEKVSIRIFDLLGREVRTLVDSEEQKAGYHAVTWNGRDKTGRAVASGVYIYQIVSDDFSRSRKMLLIK